MMQKIFYILTVFFLLLATVSYSQQRQRDTVIVKKTLSPVELQQRRERYEKNVDSSMAAREVKRMKEVFTVTPDQEKALFQAGIILNIKRREVFKSYWKKEGFREHMIQIDRSADSLYQSIVGERNVRIYKDTLQSRMVQRRILMEQRGKFGSRDTMGNKPVAKPLN